MVEFLVNKHANIDIATLNDRQTPIHFAAKNGACQSLKMLLAYGADIVSKDSKNRTPLQVCKIHPNTISSDVFFPVLSVEREGYLVCNRVVL